MSPGATMELVYAELKAKVMRGDFAPGERLEPAQLARVLGVSPTPVRDALYRLSGESDYFAAPAQAVHKFEIIQYANSTGDIF